MAKFMDVHNNMKGITKEQLKEAHQSDLDLAKESGVRFEKARADPQSGKVFCLTSAPNKEAVLDVHRKSGHPTDEVARAALDRPTAGSPSPTAAQSSPR